MLVGAGVMLPNSNGNGTGDLAGDVAAVIQAVAAGNARGALQGDDTGKLYRIAGAVLAGKRARRRNPSPTPVPVRKMLLLMTIGTAVLVRRLKSHLSAVRDGNVSGSKYCVICRSNGRRNGRLCRSAV